MSIETAKTKEKLIRAAIRAGARQFPEDVDRVLEAIVTLPDPKIMNGLPRDARDWLLQELSRHPPMPSSLQLDDSIEYPIWIVWKLNKNIPVLVAIDTSAERAERHVQLVKDEARVVKEEPPETFVEESKMNHLYGQTITGLASFKIATLTEKRKKT